MAKKTVTLDGLLNTKASPPESGIARSGEGAEPATKKRVTLALDGAAYRRLRIHAAETDQTHQAILKAALTEYLKRSDMQ